MRRGFTLVEVLVAIFIIAILIALLLPAVQSAREAARKLQCANNLKQIGLSVIQYSDRNKEYLPATWRTRMSATGKQALFGADSAAGLADWQSFSWMTTVLPFLEQQAMHDSFDYSKGAMDAVNQTGVGTTLKVYQCPSTEGFPRTTLGFSPSKRFAEVATGASDYNAVASVVGDAADTGAAWHGRAITGWTEGAWDFFERTKPASLTLVEDGRSNTTMLVEQEQRPYWWNYRTFDLGCERPCFVQGSGAGGGWAIPNDYMDASNYPINQSNVTARYSYHPGGAQQAMLDGSVQFLSEGTDISFLRAMDSRAGGEPIDATAWQ